MTIPKTVAVGDDHRTRTCIVSPNVIGQLARAGGGKVRDNGVETVARSVARTIRWTVIAPWDNHRTVSGIVRHMVSMTARSVWRLNGQDDGSAQRSRRPMVVTRIARASGRMVRRTMAASVLDHLPMVPPMARGG